MRKQIQYIGAAAVGTDYSRQYFKCLYGLWAMSSKRKTAAYTFNDKQINSYQNRLIDIS